MDESISAPVAAVPKHLWIIGVISLPWNTLGAIDYLTTQTRNEGYMSNFTAEQRAYFYSLFNLPVPRRGVLTLPRYRFSESRVPGCDRVSRLD